MCPRVILVTAILALAAIASFCDAEYTVNNFQQEEDASALLHRSAQELSDIESILREVTTRERFSPLEELIVEDGSATSTPAQLQQGVQVQQQRQAQPQAAEQVPSAAQQPQQGQAQTTEQVSSTASTAQQPQQGQAQPQAAEQVPSAAQQPQQGQAQPQEAEQVPSTAQQPQQAVAQSQEQQQPSVVVVEAPKQSDKLSKAQEFNQLVKEVDSILDDAMLAVKQDKKLFRKATDDGRNKQSDLREEASAAKQDASGHATQIEAIETHMDLASKEGAKAFLAFTGKFRKSAKKAFRKSYNDAKARQTKLNELYTEITSHVAHAVKGMEAQADKVDSKYIHAMQAYYQAHYKAKYGCKDAKKDDPCIVDAQNAEAKMKETEKARLQFQDNLKTAHHHGRKLQKQLKHAITKLHYIFKKARTKFRHAYAEFHAGYDVHFSAQKTVSQRALRKLDEEKKKAAEAKAAKATKKSHEEESSDSKNPKAGTEDQRSSSDKGASDNTKAAVDSAEIKAAKMVTKAAKAIATKAILSSTADAKLEQHKSRVVHKKVASKVRHGKHSKNSKYAKHHGTAEMMATSSKLQAENKVVKRAAKKVVNLVKKAMLRVGKQKKSAHKTNDEDQDSDSSGEDADDNDVQEMDQVVAEDSW